MSSPAAPRPEASASPAPRRDAPARAAARLAAQEAGRRSFLRLVSHELRTPLNAVIGFSEIIARELHGPINEPRYVEHAGMIRDSGLRLLSLVNQVIDIARLEAGAMDLDLRPEPVGEIVDEAFAGLAEAAAAHPVRLVREDGEAASLRVVADRRGLNTALTSLLANAIAASPREGAVTLSAKGVAGVVVLEVRDEGSGVAPGDVARLMRPFEQGESALVRSSHGAGLGLPIARLLCRAMGGRLRLRVSPAGGVVATVRLPTAL